MPSSSYYISVLGTPFCAYDISKCSSLDALHVSGICMHVTVHIDAIIIVAKVLYDVACWKLTELDDFSFSLHFVCASYEHDVYMFYEIHHAVFTGVKVLYFCDVCGDYHKHAK